MTLNWHRVFEVVRCGGEYLCPRLTPIFGTMSAPTHHRISLAEPVRKWHASRNSSDPVLESETSMRRAFSDFHSASRRCQIHGSCIRNYGPRPPCHVGDNLLEPDNGNFGGTGIRKLLQAALPTSRHSSTWLQHRKRSGYRPLDLPKVRDAARSIACQGSRPKLFQNSIE